MTMPPPQYPPGPQGQPMQQPPPPPDNNLVWAILSTVLCCIPLGIVAIVKAANVNKQWAMGQYAEAQQSAKQAKQWAIYAAIAWVVLVVLYLIIVFAFGTFTVETSY